MQSKKGYTERLDGHNKHTIALDLENFGYQAQSRIEDSSAPVRLDKTLGDQEHTAEDIRKPSIANSRIGVVAGFDMLNSDIEANTHLSAFTLPSLAHPEPLSEIEMATALSKVLFDRQVSSKKIKAINTGTDLSVDMKKILNVLETSGLTRPSFDKKKTEELQPVLVAANIDRDVILIRDLLLRYGFDLQITNAIPKDHRNNHMNEYMVASDYSKKKYDVLELLRTNDKAGQARRLSDVVKTKFLQGKLIVQEGSNVLDLFEKGDMVDLILYCLADSMLHQLEYLHMLAFDTRQVKKVTELYEKTINAAGKLVEQYPDRTQKLKVFIEALPKANKFFSLLDSSYS